MNKVKTLKLNIITSVLPWLFLAIIGFVKIRFFINIYGSELNGFIQLIAQIYGYISLVEMGFGAAITYKLYKPLMENDKKQVAKLYNGCRKIYTKVAKQMLVIGAVVGVILPFIVQFKRLEIYTMIIVFMLFAVDYLLKYIFDLPCRILLYADQKRYKANIIVNISSIVIKAIELLLIITAINYVFVLSAIIILNFISYLWIYKFTQKEYSWLKEYKEVDINTREMSKDVMAHKVSRIVFYGTDSIILSITSGLGLAATSIYGSYNYIICVVRNILDLFLTSPLEMLGNKFAKKEQDVENNYKIYREFVKATYFIGIIISGVFFVSISNLVGIWINKGYILDSVTMLVFSAYIWYECVSRTNLTMIEANGKYKETKMIEIIAVIVNIILSLILVRKFGIMGVVLATVIALMIVKQPFQNKYIYKHIFNKNRVKSILIFLFYSAIMLGICYLNKYLVTNLKLFSIYNYLSWIKSTALITIIDSTIVFLPMYFLDKSFKNAVKRFVKNKR